MHLKIVKKDLLKNKTITVMIGMFILLSSLLATTGTSVIIEMTNSMHALFSKSEVPHFVQMHAGGIDEEELERFAEQNELVGAYQASELLKIDSTNIQYNQHMDTQKNSIMDHYFTAQNEGFDYLLNLHSDIIQVGLGEIAVPVYFMKKESLSIGDTISFKGTHENLNLTIVDFVRDAQMNPSIIHSKRFVVHPSYLNILKEQIGELEYLIEFRLTDIDRLNEFIKDYDAAGLPAKGPNIDYQMFKALNAITDGIIVAVIFIVGALFFIIAMLCLRYTMLTALVNDEKEIGIMKAIGMTSRNIKAIYLLKYSIIAGISIIAGYLVSIFAKNLFTQNLLLYLGTAPKSVFQYVAPALVACVIFLIIMFYCLFILRKIDHVTSLTALHAKVVSGQKTKFHFIRLKKAMNIPFFLALRDMVARFKTYSILLLIFIICTFILIVPLHFYNTMQSPHFINYLGVEKSDIRIDLQHSDNMTEDFNKLMEKIRSDQDIERVNSTVTGQYKIQTEEGASENIIIETGDFSVFPLEYLEGKAPNVDNDIALSYLNSQELDKGVGDHLQLIDGENIEELTVTGIYQDVTNGGRTAKAMLPTNMKKALRYKISMDVKSEMDIKQKVKKYQGAFPTAKVTGISHYLTETFGNTLDRLHTLIILMFLLVISIVAFIILLFFRLLIAQDKEEIVIMKSIGFSLENIKWQYMIRAFLIGVIGIVVGIVISNIIGPILVSALLSFMGAAKISFVINAVQIYIIIPILLIGIIAITTRFSIRYIKSIQIIEE